jgi:anti-sigma B factor antagonist
VQTTTTAGWTVVALSGDVDLGTAPRLRHRLNRLLDDGASVVLDMRDLDFIDSTGLGVLVGALRRVRSAGGEIRLADLPPGIHRVFSVTGLDQVFPIFASVDAATSEG